MNNETITTEQPPYLHPATDDEVRSDILWLHRHCESPDLARIAITAYERLRLAGMGVTEAFQTTVNCLDAIWAQKQAELEQQERILHRYGV